MAFVPKETRKKVEAAYKTIYLRQSLIQAVEQIAIDNNPSFNKVVVSMIERCLEEGQDEAKE